MSSSSSSSPSYPDYKKDKRVLRAIDRENDLIISIGEAFIGRQSNSSSSSNNKKAKANSAYF